MSLIIDVVSKYPDAAELGELYRAEGFELYLVGGIVRDNLRVEDGLFTDFDLTTDATLSRASRFYVGGVNIHGISARSTARLVRVRMAWCMR